MDSTLQATRRAEHTTFRFRLSEFENAKGDFGVIRVMRVAAVLGLSVAVHKRPVTDIGLVFEQTRAIQPQ